MLHYFRELEKRSDPQSDISNEDLTTHRIIHSIRAQRSEIMRFNLKDNKINYEHELLKKIGLLIRIYAVILLAVFLPMNSSNDLATASLLALLPITTLFLIGDIIEDIKHNYENNPWYMMLPLLLLSIVNLFVIAPCAYPLSLMLFLARIFYTLIDTFLINPTIMTNNSTYTAVARADEDDWIWSADYSEDEQRQYSNHSKESTARSAAKLSATDNGVNLSSNMHNIFGGSGAPQATTNDASVAELSIK
ncbi:MAG: hypothetical protein Q8R83_10035 [Legionellaceae bacterium]|nr:hypothetical protein [Legionellaceae bacterium]